MSEFQKDFITVFVVIMSFVWGSCCLIQDDKERIHEQEMEKIEAGFIYVPEVKGHWVKK